MQKTEKRILLLKAKKNEKKKIFNGALVKIKACQSRVSDEY